MTQYIGGQQFADDGSLQTTTIVPSPSFFRGPWAHTFDGKAYTVDAGAAVPGTAFHQNGRAFASDGALYTTTDAPSSTSVYIRGQAYRADGAMHVNSGAVSGAFFANGQARTALGALFIGGGVSYSAEALLVFAAFTTPPDAARKAVIDALIVSLKSAGIWTLCDRIYTIAAADSQADRIDWKNPGTDTLAVTATVTFTADRGIQGDGIAGKYLGATAFSSFTKFTQNDAHISVWNRIDAQSAASLVGTETNAVVVLNPRNASNQTSFRVNEAASVIPAVVSGIGHFLAQRTGANATEVFQNGVSLGTGANASVAPSVAKLAILMANSTFNSAHQAAFCSVGGSMDATHVTNFYNAVHTYMTAVGA